MGVKLGISYCGKNIEWGDWEQGVFSPKSGEVIKVCRKMDEEEFKAEKRKNLQNLRMDGMIYYNGP